MLRTTALRKIFITTLTMFILLTIYTIPTTEDSNVLRTNLEIEEITSLSTNSIYLLNEDGYLVKSRIILDSEDKKDCIAKILNNLIEREDSKFSNELHATIPEGTKVKEIIYGNELVTIDFSKEFLEVDVSVEKQMISSIVYSIMDLGQITGVSILVEGVNLSEYPNTHEKLPSVLDKNIGINKKYLVNSRNNISKVVIYYLEDIDNQIYYVPVTKYVNDDRDKIKIIVEELASNYIYENNLMSFLNNKVELLNYKEENNSLILNFNEYLFDHSDKVLEEVIYSISYSVFDNYEVEMVMFEVEGEKIQQISKGDL